MAQFRKVYKLQGFDREAVPRWQMVPMTESRYIVLRGGAGLAVTSADPVIATVTEIARETCQSAPLTRPFKLPIASSGSMRSPGASPQFRRRPQRVSSMSSWRSTQRT